MKKIPDQMLLLVLATALVSNVRAADATAPPVPLAGIGRDAYVHDPSTVVKCKDEFWVFYTGRGVPSLHSKDLITWQRGPGVFTNAPAWVAQAIPANRRLDYWAPDVIQLEDRYLLYYAASSFGKNTSGIGLATNPTLDPADPAYHWTDQGMIVKSVPSVDFNTIDPAVFHDANGSLWLPFGSFWSGIRMIELDPKTGRRIATNSPIYSLAHYSSIEASYLYQRGGWYYLFVDWGFCCRGARSTYNIRLGRSEKVTGPYLDKSGVDMLYGGGSLFLATTGNMIGPGHAGIVEDKGTNWFTCHFESDGARNGRSTLAVMPLFWNAEGWPQVK